MEKLDEIGRLVEEWLDDQGEKVEVDRLGRIEAHLVRIERVLGQLARNPSPQPNVRETVTLTYSRERAPRIAVPANVASLNSEVKEHPLFLKMREIVEKKVGST